MKTHSSCRLNDYTFKSKFLMKGVALLYLDLNFGGL